MHSGGLPVANPRESRMQDGSWSRKQMGSWLGAFQFWGVATTRGGALKSYQPDGTGCLRSLREGGKGGSSWREADD